MFHSERFSIKAHLPYLYAWLGVRKLYIPPPEEMPELGTVTLYRGEPIAMAFIRKVEGGFGQMDGMTTNPDAPPELRNGAVDHVTTQVMIIAKESGISTLIAHTKDENTQMRAAKHGFVTVPQTIFAVDLRQWTPKGIS